MRYILLFLFLVSCSHPSLIVNSFRSPDNPYLASFEGPYNRYNQILYMRQTTSKELWEYAIEKYVETDNNIIYAFIVEMPEKDKANQELAINQVSAIINYLYEKNVKENQITFSLLYIKNSEPYTIRIYKGNPK